MAAGLPQDAFLLLSELAIGLKDGKLILLRIFDNQILEPAHLLSPPAGDGAVINALGLVRYHQVLADANNLPQTAANGTGPQRTVEGEQVFIRLPEYNTVFFKAGTEVHEIPGRSRG